MNTQLVRVLLSDEGYDLHSACNSDEALKVLSTFNPGLIIMDVQLPGKSGLELTRELRANSEINSASIVALTAYGGKDDEQNCLNAGCDGYILKPIDTSAFPATVRSYMDKKSLAVPKVQGDIRDLLRGMRNSLITEALVELSELLAPGFSGDRNRLLRVLHRWAGIGGTLGMPAVTDEARKIETLVQSSEQVNVPTVKLALVELQRLFTAAAAAPAFELDLPPEIVKALSGKRIALTGFSDQEARRIAQVMDRAECFTLVIATPHEGLSAAMVERFDLVVLNLDSTAGSACRDTTNPALSKPILLVGSRATILSEIVSIEMLARDFLTTPWDSEELLVRCCKLLTPDLRYIAPVEREGPAQVVITDDDPEIGALLTATLRRTGAECRLAHNGVEALAWCASLYRTLFSWMLTCLAWMIRSAEQSARRRPHQAYSSGAADRQIPGIRRAKGLFLRSQRLHYETFQADGSCGSDRALPTVEQGMISIRTGGAALEQLRTGSRKVPRDEELFRTLSGTALGFLPSFQRECEPAESYNRMLTIVRDVWHRLIQETAWSRSHEDKC
jgi:two-component system cell cycle response regulator DivK